MIYLDNAATTVVLPEVVQAMQAVLTGDFGNPSSRHPVGLAAQQQLHLVVGEPEGEQLDAEASRRARGALEQRVAGEVRAQRVSASIDRQTEQGEHEHLRRVEA